MKDYYFPQSSRGIRSPRVVLTLLLAITFMTATPLSGCKDNQAREDKPSESILDTLHSSVSDIGKTIDSTTKETRENVQQLASQELEKLYKYEYKVVSFQASLSDQELEAQLAELGKDRWNCFHGETVNGSTRLICSRLPVSVLKLVPYIWKVF